MNYRQRLFFWLINMTTVVFMAAGLMIYLLYQTALQGQKTRLFQTAQTQARLLESMYLTTGNAEIVKKTVADTSKLRGNQQTATLNIGKLLGNQIILINERSQPAQQTIIPWSNNRFQAMHKALQGNSGIMSDLDDQGVKVLAAYEPVEHLNWGVVAKVDLAELRAPYIQAGIQTLLGIGLVDGLGVLLLGRLFNPIVQELEKTKKLTQDLENRNEKHKDELWQLNQQFHQEFTERQRLEDVLQREMDLLARIMETNPVGILIVNPSEEILIANKQAEKMLGLIKTEQFYQMPPWQVRDEAGNLIYDQKHLCKQVIESRQSIYDVREKIEFPDGTCLFVSINASPVFDETRIESIVFTIEDINERKQAVIALQESEERYRRIIETTAEGVWSIDINNRTSFINQRMAQMLGYTVEEMLGKSLLDFTDAEGQADALQKIERRRQGISETHDFKFLCKDGTSLWTMISTNPIFDAQGNYAGALGMLTDITERKQTEEALQKANTQLTAWIRELEQRNQDILLLNQISDFLQACLTVAEAYQVIDELLPTLFTEYSGGLFMINNTSNLVEAVATWGEDLYSTTHFTYDECWALRRGKIHWIDQFSQVVCQHVEFDLAMAHHQSLCVPMMAQGKALGLLYLYDAQSKNISEAKQQLAQTVAEHLSLVLANLILRETLQTQSIIDALTNLYNRRYMEESLKREINLAKRKRHPVGVMMLDVDHFRQFNKTFGHEGGNCALQAVGRFLSSQIRSGDIACRYGGEEFLLILPEASLEIIVQRAEQIRQGIKQLQVTYGEQVLSQITVSIGIACFPEYGKTMEELIKSADQALYQAKNEGRDRVVCHSAS